MQIPARTHRSLLALAALLLVPTAAQAQTKLLRFPDLHGESVVFCYAGDLWTASARGGTAARLTAHPGQELFPKFSPDGRWVAFTGQYDGDEQVYVMPARGGVPRQLTWYPAEGPMPPRWGYDNQVYGWTPDGSAVLFRSLRDSWDWGAPQLFTVAVDGGLPVPLPMPESGAGSFAPDGKRVVYSPLFRDFRTWKRYEGGWAQDLYVFDLETGEASRLTDHPRTDRDPMWLGGSILFSSDRDDKLNLYRTDPTGGETVQLTDHADWDVRWPSAAPDGRIVYELGGELRVLDTASGESTSISIFVPDDGVSKRPERVSAAGDVEDFDLSPGGERALFVARGDVFTAPVEEGLTRNLTRSSTAHDREAAWSPDGDRIAYVSDASGEEQIWLVDQDGAGEPEQLTRGSRGRIYDPAWSPDGERIAFCDKEGVLQVVTVADGSVTAVADEIFGRIGDHTWSPCGTWLAFSTNEPSQLSSIHVWSAADGVLRRVTDEHFEQSEPAWGRGGDYLYFLADHSFAPQIGSREWNYVLDRETEIYALALRDDVEHPFPPRNDEVPSKDDDDDDDDDGDGDGDDDDDADADGNEDGDDEDEDGDEDGDEEDDEDEIEPIEIDFDGLGERVARVPVEGDNYVGLITTEGHLLYARTGAFYYGRSSGVDTSLESFDLKEREAETKVEDISGYALSHDGEKLLVRSGGSFQLHEVSGGDPKTVSTSGLVVDRVPAEEWATMFDEVWRRFRDYFYVANMHGYDWDALRAQYRPLLEHVAHRSDLNYVLGEMVAELNVSHAYITGGDYEIPDRVPVALSGARFELDADAGRYRVARILQGQNTEERYRSPLTEVGVDVDVGDFVLAINGADLGPNENPYRLLRSPAGAPVELLVNDSPEREGARTVLLRPISGEGDLLYLEWVTANRRRVAEATDGRVGYLHVPDMGSNGIREFIKWYYPQVRKEGLVVDVRSNGGGNVSQMLIERLRRELYGVDFTRTYGQPTTYPSVTFVGHMVCLINETSASDGDIFAWTFRKAGLGPLIGKRTWGGIIGITGHGPLLDGGGTNVPQFGNAGPDGQWLVEGVGVEPDIVVENDPAAVLAGGDPQLERGIAEVMARIEAEPRGLPKRPADPVKSY